MISAVFDKSFTLPDVRPMTRGVSLTRDRLAQHARKTGAANPVVSRIINRIVELRGPQETFLTDVALGDLVPQSVQMAQHSRPTLTAPLVLMRKYVDRFVAKIVFNVVSRHALRPDDFIGYHSTCRRAGIEYMCITDEHVADGYIESRYFKINFKAAYFADPMTNGTVFCPTLRDWGIEQWSQAACATRG